MTYPTKSLPFSVSLQQQDQSIAPKFLKAENFFAPFYGRQATIIGFDSDNHLYQVQLAYKAKDPKKIAARIAEFFLLYPFKHLFRKICLRQVYQFKLYQHVAEEAPPPVVETHHSTINPSPHSHLDQLIENKSDEDLPPTLQIVKAKGTGSLTSLNAQRNKEHKQKSSSSLKERLTFSLKNSPLTGKRSPLLRVLAKKASTPFIHSPLTSEEESSISENLKKLKKEYKRALKEKKPEKIFSCATKLVAELTVYPETDSLFTHLQECLEEASRAVFQLQEPSALIPSNFESLLKLYHLVVIPFLDSQLNIETQKNALKSITLASFFENLRAFIKACFILQDRDALMSGDYPGLLQLHRLTISPFLEKDLTAHSNKGSTNQLEFFKESVNLFFQCQGNIKASRPTELKTLLMLYKNKIVPFLEQKPFGKDARFLSERRQFLIQILKLFFNTQHVDDVIPHDFNFILSLYRQITFPLLRQGIRSEKLKTLSSFQVSLKDIIEKVIRMQNKKLVLSNEFDDLLRLYYLIVIPYLEDRAELNDEQILEKLQRHRCVLTPASKTSFLSRNAPPPDIYHYELNVGSRIMAYATTEPESINVKNHLAIQWKNQQDVSFELFCLLESFDDLNCLTLLSHHLESCFKQAFETVDGQKDTQIWRILKKIPVQLSRLFKESFPDSSSEAYLNFALIINTTANINTLWTGNVGHCRSVMHLHEKNYQCSTDAVPSQIEHYQLNEKYFANGFLKRGGVLDRQLRVSIDNNLETLRSIGSSHQGISSRPQINRYHLDPNKMSKDDYLIVATPELWQHMGSEQALIEAKSLPLNQIPKRLYNLAYSRGSSRPLSLMAISLFPLYQDQA